MLGLNSSIFSHKTGGPALPGTGIATRAEGEIAPDFRPKKGDFFQTLEFAERGEDQQITGKNWLEALLDPATQSWTVWTKNLRRRPDPLTGGMANVLSQHPLLEKISFVDAYSQMIAFEQGHAALGSTILGEKTPARLGGDYFRHFAWREGLIASRSGRLFPSESGQARGDGFFDAEEIANARAFAERMKDEDYIPVPYALPQTDWRARYKAQETQIDARLNLLTQRYPMGMADHGFAVQLAGQERPEVLYAALQQGFQPNAFAGDAEKHMAIVKAALNRPDGNAQALAQLADAGFSFFARSGNETPVRLALRANRYAHLHAMLGRGGQALANFAAQDGLTPAMDAAQSQDRQAFHRLRVEGIDFSARDAQGWKLIHHAFASDFPAAAHAWLDEALPIDEKIAGTDYTPLSLARHFQRARMIEFGIKNQADPAAPAYDPQNAPAEKAAPAAAEPAKIDPDPMPAPPVPVQAAPIPVPAASKPSSALSDAEILALLKAAVGGGSFDLAALEKIKDAVRDPNIADSGGNTILHMLQLNKHDVVARSANVKAVIDLFPGIDFDKQNADGYSNFALAVRLDRSQTLKLMLQTRQPDLTQTTAGGWSMLDIALTSACEAAKLNHPRARDVAQVSEPVRDIVLDALDRAMSDAQKKDAVIRTLARTRPDGRTLADAMQAENSPATARISRYLSQPVPFRPEAKPQSDASHVNP